MAYSEGASSGNLVFLSKQTPVAAASITFTSLITTTYNDYVLRITNLTGDQAFADINVQYSSDNGATYLNTADYVWTQLGQNSGGTIATTFGGQTSANIFTNNENVANSQGGGVVEFFNITAGNAFPIYISRTYYGGAFSTFCSQGGQYNVVTAVNAIKLLASAGTFSGTFKLYGVQK